VGPPWASQAVRRCSGPLENALDDRDNREARGGETVITSEVLYQLSYVGAGTDASAVASSTDLLECGGHLTASIRANICEVRAALCLVLVMGLVLASGAGAAETPEMEVFLEGNGSGGMIASSNVEAPPGGTFSWQACAPDGMGCIPFASGQKVGTADARPNTVFVVTPSDAPTERSPVWHGDVTASTLPSVSGQVRANTLVTPVAGTWRGGWAGDLNRTELAECRHPDGTGCSALTDLGGAACAHEAVVLDPAFTGRYLRIADQTYAADAPVDEDTEDSLAFLGFVWPPGPTTSVAVLGRIAPATGPRTDHCGPAPRALGPEPSATLSKQDVATIRCPAACTIVLRADRGPRRVQVTRTLAEWGTVKVHLSARSLLRLGHGRAVLSIEVDGAVLLRRTLTVA
jgi:hypothetical protein